MKITAFAATNSKESINLELVKHVSSHFEDARVNLLDLNDYEMPIFSPERALDGIPQAASDFLDAIQDSDMLIIGLAEYNGSYTSAFKNIFDWSSRIDMKVFKDKPTLLLSTSPGPRGASTVLESAKNSLPFYGAKVWAAFSLPSYFENFKDQSISDPTHQENLQRVVSEFKNLLLEPQV